MQFKPTARVQAAEPMAGFLHPPLNENLSDEAIDDALALSFDFLISSIYSMRNSGLNNFQVVSFLVYIGNKDSFSSAANFLQPFLVLFLFSIDI
jgi:hypothetical protein